MRVQKVILLFILSIFIFSCVQSPTPKPRGYFRISLPEKKYQVYDSSCPYTFEYPVYGEIKQVEGVFAEPCWFNINFSDYHATLYLTYKELDGNLAIHMEDVRTLVYKHIIKADDIEENIVIGHKEKVYGIIYNLSGNTASTTTFFVTDSTRHFLTGSLYFSAIPNKDSLAPAIEFFQQDIVHLTKSLSWK
ncbi:MAG TPA: gliding motility lipoprotein GldD [Bacteroidales bacterium]|jgi:gliding motility-associated lipoprotein GldD|nr:gliding motility lipoprotein GldD [Bacteroidales bacterium]